MLIALGSASQQKFQIANTALAKLGLRFTLVSVNVLSGIAEQPLGLADTLDGAKNRVRGAFEAGKFDLGLGLEAGLQLTNSRYYLIAGAVLFDGTNYCIGSSKPVALPLAVSRAIGQGQKFGQVIRGYYKTHPGKHIHQLITREKVFSEAVHDAMFKYQKQANSLKILLIKI